MSVNLMKRRTFIETVVLATCGAAIAQGGAAAGAEGFAQGGVGDRGTLLVCGGPQVLRLDVRFAAGTASLVSRTAWQAETSAGMPREMAGLFKTTDDCKPIDGAARVLVTSSGGAVAIFERESGATRFHAAVPNAHSADLLPNNRVVAAASVSPDGNKLMVFDRAASGRAGAGAARGASGAGDTGGATAVFTTPLESAHGVVWVAEEQLLWALGLTELRAYALVDWDGRKPSLQLRETFTLPSRGGHDLSPVPHEPIFIVTTEHEVLTFDRRTRKFAPYQPLATLPDVKSVSIHPTTGRVVFMQADRPEWWTRTIRFFNEPVTMAFPEDRLYKARWA